MTGLIALESEMEAVILWILSLGMSFEFSKIERRLITAAFNLKRIYFTASLRFVRNMSAGIAPLSTFKISPFEFITIW